MSAKQTITAVIPAKNESENIDRCLKSLAWCDRIIVLSMGNDDTAEKAKNQGAEVAVRNQSDHNDFVAVQENINWAIDTCTTDWIIRLDADEEVTPELTEEIQHILAMSHDSSATNPSPVAYGVPRRQYFWGGFLTGGDWAYDRLVRLFRAKSARYDPIVHIHEQFRVDGPIAYLTHPLNHYSHPTLAVAVKKFNSYTSLQIHDLHDTRLQASIKMLFLPPYIFLRWFFWHRGFKDGLRGVVAGLMRAWYEFILYAKYIEAYNKS